MEDRRDLNDIVMAGEDIKVKQTKKLTLLIAAIVVLVLAITLIAMNMVGSKQDEVLVVGSETITPPAPASFESVPVSPAPSEDDQFEKIVQEIKSRQKAPTNEPPIPETPVAAAPKQEPKVTLPTKTQPKVAIKSTPRTATTANPSAQTPRASRAVRAKNGDIAERGHYLQVGAFSKTPSSDFLDAINQYSYRKQEIMINSKVITRYLVGPYASRNDAQKDFGSVSRELTTPVFLEVQ